MKNRIFLIVSMFLAIGFLTTNLSAQEPTPTPYVRTAEENASIEKALDAARRGGKATVIIVFDEPFVPNSPEYAARVKALQDELLERLIPYQVTLHYRYTVIPGMALEGSEAALMVIRDSPRVRYFELDAVVTITPPPPPPHPKKRRLVF